MNRRRAIGSSVNDPSTIGYSLRPSLDAAIASKPRLLRTRGVSPGRRNGFAGDLPAGNSTGGASTLPVGVDVQEERAELLTDPERCRPRLPHHRLDVEVAAGQQPLGCGLVDDGEGDTPSGSRREMNPPTSIAPGAAAAVSHSRRDVVQAQQEIGRVGLGAEAVVGHRPERAVAVVDHAGEAGDHLARERPGAPVGRCRSAPDGGPGAWKSASSVARATSVGPRLAAHHHRPERRWEPS